ncbi:MAG: FAD-binding oxidoreductase [Eubacteriales bacterium]
MEQKTELTGVVIYANDSRYLQARMNWNPFTNKFPLVFVFAQQEKDVANAVKWARENHVPIRIRSGRHALAQDFSQSDCGIVIDMGDMQDVKLDKERGIATVQTGIRVGALVRMLAKEGVLAPFGDSSTVGIGGITPGGGITAIQRSVGVISDNLIAGTLVDANGEIIHFNERRNPDLLWAMRGGGGGNFGVATSYTFRIHPAPDRVGIYQIIWPWEQIEEVVDAWQKWSPYVDTRLGSILEVYSKTNGLLRSQGIFLGSKKELINQLKPLAEVGTPIRVFVDEVSLSEAIDFWAPEEPLFDDQYTTWSSAWVERTMPEEGIDAIKRFLIKSTGSESNFFFLNSGGAMNRVPPNDTAFFWRNTKYYMEWTSSWTKNYETQRNIVMVERTRRELVPYTIGSYVNVPDLALKNYGQEYYGGNFERLRRIKTKYDPENVFNFAQSIPPCF